MINAYNELTTYTGNDWDDFLDKCSLINIFEPVLERYKDNSLRRQIIQYIVKCYSVDSPDIVYGMEWGRMKKIIFEKVMLPQLMYHEIVLFHNIHETKEENGEDFELVEKYEKDKDIQALRKSITRWLNFQDSEAFVQWAVLRDLRQEMQASANSPIKKSSGEIDYDQKYKNAKYAMDIRDLIKNIEEELIQNSETLKVAVQEVKKGKVKTSFGLESMLNGKKE